MEKKSQAKASMLKELSKEMSDDMYSPMKDMLKDKKLKKVNRVVLDEHITFKEVINEVENLIRNTKFAQYKINKPILRKDKKRMVIEPMIGDIHYGLKTKAYDLKSARKAVSTVAQVALEEYNRYKLSYNIEKFNLLLMGDLIQSATMHKDSHAYCELTDAQQIATAIESLFEDLILPIARLGHKVDIIGVCGNHDRSSPDKHTVNPGLHYYTYTIYKSLELICKQSGFNNVNFIIPRESYHVYDIFGSHFLVEHGDNAGKGSRKDLEGVINSRSVQTNKLLSGVRIGHFHNEKIGSLGRYIVNGSTVHEDPYGNHLGFKSRPCQLINYYVETDRSTPYYHSLIVNLED